MSHQAYMSVKFVKQGQMKGESINPNRSNKWIDCVGFDYSTRAPFDRSQGGVSGKRQHPPIKITKEFGASSPQLLDAQRKNEVFSEVVIEVVDAAPLGFERVMKRITLTDAL